MSILAPPYTQATLTAGIKWVRSSMSPAICWASSRVGARMTACGYALSGWMCSATGMPKAQVLPVPVGALAITSLPCIIRGITFSCISVISSKPIRSTAWWMASLHCNSLYCIFLRPICSGRVVSI